MNAIDLSEREFLQHCERAWVVDDGDGDEGRSTVVYARNAMEARRLAFGVDDVGCFTEEEYLHVRRAPEFDDLGGKPLREAQLDNGWWFTCGYCDCGRLAALDRYIDEDEEIPMEPVILGDDVYCSPWCAGAEAVRHVRRRIEIWEILTEAVATFPGAVILGVEPNSWRESETAPRGSVTFSVDELPGVKIMWFRCAPTIDLPPYMHAAWEAYKERRDRLRALGT